jgi:hypothetical protein
VLPASPRTPDLCLLGTTSLKELETACHQDQLRGQKGLADHFGRSHHPTPTCGGYRADPGENLEPGEPSHKEAVDLRD